ncbi:MAG: HrpE/YscL family type III secretion apparatus protein [Chlamydiae bacterium]|nr:HrpE/YscL family type III secretion apparatus protein [Chlamydiota bacterium]
MKFFSLLYQGDIHFAADKKIIPREEIDQLISAKEIIEKAQQDALTYRQNVEAECEDIKKKAYDDGYQEGLSRFNEQLMHFEQQIRKISHETQKAIIPIALKAAKKIVGSELKLHPEAIVDIVLQALAPVKQNHKIKIYVNKEDKQVLEDHKQDLRAIFESLQSLSILERADVSPGGCIIETESGIINASIENQWRALESAFEKYMKA